MKKLIKTALLSIACATMLYAQNMDYKSFKPSEAVVQTYGVVSLQDSIITLIAPNGSEMPGFQTTFGRPYFIVMVRAKHITTGNAAAPTLQIGTATPQVVGSTEYNDYVFEVSDPGNIDVVFKNPDLGNSEQGSISTNKIVINTITFCYYLNPGERIPDSVIYYDGAEFGATWAHNGKMTTGESIRIGNLGFGIYSRLQGETNWKQQATALFADEFELSDIPAAQDSTKFYRIYHGGRDVIPIWLRAGINEIAGRAIMVDDYGAWTQSAISTGFTVTVDSLEHPEGEYIDGIWYFRLNLTIDKVQ